MNTAKNQHCESKGFTSTPDSDFVCHHNFDRLHLEKKQDNLKKSYKRLERKKACVDKKLEDVDHFFDSFGYFNDGNIATYLMEKYSEKKMDRQEKLEKKLLDLESKIIDGHKRLDSLDESALVENCGCMDQL